MKMKIAFTLKWILISTVVGLVTGCLSAFFLTTLNWVTAFRETHTWLIWLLPAAGFGVGLLYHLYGRSIEGGNNLILDEIHEPREIVPLRMVPLILIGTWLTHLFGGSAGREGTAVQMGASAADQFAKRFRLSPDERTTLLMAGMSAGFGSVFGVPFAGALFGIEVLSIGQIRFRRAFECLVASFVGHLTVLALQVHHTLYGSPELPNVDLRVIGSVLVAGLLFGLLARSFSVLIHSISALFKKYISFPPLRPLIGGLLVIAGYYLIGNYRYAGLGIPVIEESIRQSVPAADSFYKSLFTLITLGSGMKGGEVTPLLFIGATFGNSLAVLLPLSFSLLAALGFVGVFAGAANTPLACTVMAMEIFGPGVGLMALIACYASWLVSGHRGIYHSQRIVKYKPSLLAPRINDRPS
jgi:H+/Cl- antiporter ClcA